MDVLRAIAHHIADKENEVDGDREEELLGGRLGLHALNSLVRLVDTTMRRVLETLVRIERELSGVEMRHGLQKGRRARKEGAWRCF